MNLIEGEKTVVLHKDNYFMHQIDTKNRTASIRPSLLPTELIDAVKSDMTKRFDEKVRADQKAKTAVAALISQAHAPLRSLVEGDPKALAAVQELKNIRQIEGRSRQVQPEQRTKPFIDLIRLQPSSGALVGPPYDDSWTHGDGRADQKTGDFGFNVSSIAPGGLAGAGMGVFVTTSQEVDVLIEPLASYEYFWNRFRRPL